MTIQPAVERIREEFKVRKSRNPAFSLRSYARWLQVSPAQLSQVLSGKRRLSPALVSRFSERIGLSPQEKLELLHSVSPEIALEVGRAASERRRMQMADDQFKLIADWYHLGILSLTHVPDASDDPRWIARRLGISVADANEALLRLRRLGVLSEGPDFKQVCDPIEVSASIPSRAVRNYHRQNLALAMDRLESAPIEKREFQSITMAINPRKIPKFRQILDEFLTESNRELARGSLEEVYTLSVQLFPVSLKESKQ